VLSDGPEVPSYACFTHGQNSFFVEDPSQALGYVDDYLAGYLYHHARTFAMPAMLQHMATHELATHATSMTDPVSNVSFPAIASPDLQMTLVLNDTTMLPYMMRSYESHAIFGLSTNDIVFSDYRPVKLHGNISLLLPHRFQTVYNSKDVIEDFVVESIALNPVFPPDFFAPLPRNSENSESSNDADSTATSSSTYNRAEVHDFFEAGLWSGPFDYNTSSVVASHTEPSLPQVHTVYIGDYADYVQLVIELEHGVLVTDAPPHRSTLLLDWIQQTLQKPVTHIVPSHHHHDHAYGIADFVRAGAAIVVPAVATDFYRSVNNGNVTIITYDEFAPFVLADNAIQFRSYFHVDPPHAKDWSYGLVTKACAARENSTDNPTVLFNADVWSPGGEALRFDLTGARQWLDSLVEDGVPLNSTVVGSHGSVDSTNGENSGSTTQKLAVLSQMAAFAYPDFQAKPFC
jgi:hypothetical protein